MTRASVPFPAFPQQPAESAVQFQSPAAEAGTQAPGAAPGAAPTGGSPWTFWIMLLLLFGFMWFFVIRPESRRRKQQATFHAGLKKGDDVVTIGGMHGTIAAIEGDGITLKVNGEIRLKFDRNAIQRLASTPATNAPPPAKS
jgi:preprotein translocase subunit YajC